MAIERDYAREGGVWDENPQRWAWCDHLGCFHRLEGPAVIRANGVQEWLLHGELHRANGPAWVDTTGLQEWWLHGLLHRADGPAVTHSDGSEEWHVQGRDITEEVRAWLHDNSITLPFTAEQLMEFGLRWM